MQNQPDPFKLSFFRQLIPHRQIMLTISIPMNQASQRLEEAFVDDIFLRGSFWRCSRHYWGHMHGKHFVLHGPKAHRQFCFRTRGILDNRGEQLVVQLLIQLSRRDIFGLLYSLAFVLGFLFFASREGGIFLMPFLPFFVGFIYVMVQWHLSHYSAEISKLVAEIIKGLPLTSD
ncbi:hypothetical protein [Acaryochloris sp. IP29b_bin.148]|uniref:hypothetical protein n=1 Tax=Acaryochloris sp. IP29b_bin.148 TaxID=2969218 RepID=UPI002616E451|nr:hypothetical protein [Acaryochloris sp. IP29b_bin.148]